MNKATFMENQYLVLRDEIKDIKQRIFKIIALALIGIPIAYSFAIEMGCYNNHHDHTDVYNLHYFEPHHLAFILPVIINLIAIWYLSEHSMLMRCGRYVRTEVETNITSDDKKPITGWETWLESGKSWRMANKLEIILFCLFLLIYYVLSACLAMHYTPEDHRTGFMIFYVLLLVLTIGFSGCLCKLSMHTTK